MVAFCSLVMQRLLTHSLLVLDVFLTENISLSEIQKRTTETGKSHLMSSINCSSHNCQLYHGLLGVSGGTVVNYLSFILSQLFFFLIGKVHHYFLI